MALCLSGAEVDELIVDALQAFGKALKVPQLFIAYLDLKLIYSMFFILLKVNFNVFIELYQDICL